MLTHRQLTYAENILSHINDSKGVIETTSFESLFTEAMVNKYEVAKIEREVRFVTACLEKDFNLIRKIKGEGIEDIPIVLTALTKEGAKALNIGVRKYFKEEEENEKLNHENLKLSVDNAKKAKTRSNIAFIISILAIILSLFLNKLVNSVENVENKGNNCNYKSEIRSSELLIIDGDTIAVIPKF